MKTKLLLRDISIIVGFLLATYFVGHDILMPRVDPFFLGSTEPIIYMLAGFFIFIGVSMVYGIVYGIPTTIKDIIKRYSNSKKRGD